MIEAVIRVKYIRCVSCFAGPPLTLLATPATLINLLDNPGAVLYIGFTLETLHYPWISSR